MTARDILCLFGRPQNVSNITGAQTKAVQNWYREGIPPKVHHSLVMAAADLKISGVTHEALLAASAASKKLRIATLQKAKAGLTQRRSAAKEADSFPGV